MAIRFYSLEKDSLLLDWVVVVVVEKVSPSKTFQTNPNRPENPLFVCSAKLRFICWKLHSPTYTFRLI